MPDGADDYALATMLAHDPAFPDGSVVPPIYQTSLFTFGSYAEMEDTFAGRVRRPIYSRGDNPTVMAFEERLAAIEGAEAARGFASGMGAITAAILSIAEAGDRIVATRHVYGDAFRLFEKLLPRLGIRVDYVDCADLDAVARALPGAKLLYLENPTSMVFELHELPRLAAMARAQGIRTIADNSWATPVFQNPIRAGVDIVVHSASKYLGGHSDVVAGVAAGSRELIRRIDELTYPFLGAKLSPLDGWLLLRGMRTLTLRMKRHEESGVTIARRLAEHPSVARVMHPVFSNHPGRATLSGTSGLFSIEVAEGVDVPRLVDAFRLFRLGVSWGGHESLAVPVAASIKQTPKTNSFAAFDVSERTIRFAIGLEDPEDLWTDLERALAAGRV